VEAIKKNLREILDKMDVPDSRKELNVHNLKWLGRNLAIRNRHNGEFPSAVHFIQTLLVMMGENPCVTTLSSEWITPQKAAKMLGQEPPFDGLNRSRN